MKIFENPKLGRILHLPSLVWMLDPTLRRSGRSTTLAVASVLAAYRAQASEIKLLDHHGHPGRERNMMVYMVEEILTKYLRDGDYKLHKSKGTLAIRAGVVCPEFEMTGLLVLFLKAVVSFLRKNGIDTAEILSIVKSQLIEDVMSQ